MGDLTVSFKLSKENHKCLKMHCAASGVSIKSFMTALVLSTLDFYQKTVPDVESSENDEVKHEDV